MKDHPIEYRINEQESKRELVPLKTVWGEAKAWETLAGMDPRAVSAAAGAAYDPSRGTYAVQAFGISFSVSPQDGAITSDDPRGSLFLGRYKDFFKLALPWYLTSAKDIPPSGRLVRPVDVKGGHRFSTGTHLLPLDAIAERFKKDKARFVQQGLAFGAEIVKYGDAGLRLYPLPRVPVTVILWLEDEEFPARVTLFFDSTVDYQLTLSDIVWSVAMLSALVLQE